MARGFSRNSYSQPASLGRAMDAGCRRAAARAMRATKAMRARRLKSAATRATTNSRKTPQRPDTRLPATTLATTLAMASGRSSGRGSGVGRRAAASYHGLRFPRGRVCAEWRTVSIQAEAITGSRRAGASGGLYCAGPKRHSPLPGFVP